MTNELPKKTFIVVEVLKTYTAKANSAREAIDLVHGYGYSPNCPNCESRFSVCECVIEHDEPDTYADFSSCNGCEECHGDPTKWHREQTVATTYETLKRAQAEAIRQGVTLAIAYLEDINYHTGANALGELLEAMNGVTDLPEWQEETVVETVEFVKAWKKF